MTDAPPHPRETFDWLGEDAERAFVDALTRGRLHHAWLLTGPEGVGKATFAYRAARRLLGAAPDPASGQLGAAPADPVSRQIMARAHPDLLVLQRDTEDGKPRRLIPVDEARELGAFFTKSPAAAPWRVAIIDAADDLNDSAANAILKTLEEPPERGVLLMVSHTPGRLMATLRSRCRRLGFKPPAAHLALRWLSERGALDPETAAVYLEIAGGAPGGAWRLAREAGLEMDAAAIELLRSLPGGDGAHLPGLADRFRATAGAGLFQLFFNRLGVRAQEKARSLASSRALLLDADRWAEAAAMLAKIAARAEAVNLDRGDALHTAVGLLRGLA